MKHKKHTFTRSFYFACEGIAHSIRTERNMRVHISIAAFILYFSWIYDLPKVELAILILAISSVIMAELINTSIEITVDLANPNYHMLAKHAKDTAAGFVLAAAASSAIIGFILFFDVDKLALAYNKIIEDTGLTVSFLSIIVLGLVFVLFGGKRHK